MNKAAMLVGYAVVIALAAHVVWIHRHIAG